MTVALDPYTRVVKPGVTVKSAEKEMVKDTKKYAKDKETYASKVVGRMMKQRVVNRPVIKKSKVTLDIRRLGL